MTTWTPSRALLAAAALALAGAAEIAAAASIADRVMLNPQPLPPREAGIAARINTPGVVSGLSVQGGPVDPIRVRPGMGLNSYGGEVMLNPQPLPPKEVFGARRMGSPGDEASLNPQPLPPRWRR